ncbi:MAG: hypothetical protein MZW92_41470 [Comamonadaceae bacterium]|nr:hypothetical protein [Comamonadaceae bacterium]
MYVDPTAEVMAAFPNLSRIALTLRELQRRLEPLVGRAAQPDGVPDRADPRDPRHRRPYRHGRRLRRRAHPRADADGRRDRTPRPSSSPWRPRPSNTASRAISTCRRRRTSPRWSRATGPAGSGGRAERAEKAERADMTKDEVLGRLLAERVVAVIRMKDADRLAAAAAALGRGGVRAVEVTMTVPGAVGIIREMARTKAVGALVGAGTVLDAATAAAVIAAGADFVVLSRLRPGHGGGLPRGGRGRRAGGLHADGDRRGLEGRGGHRQGLPGDLARASVRARYARAAAGGPAHADRRGDDRERARFPGGGRGVRGVGHALVDAKAVAAGDWAAIEERARRLVASLGGT